MADHLQQLLDSLLWEGYALYPYTPTSTKNATPTPFGIVYPPAYAEALTTTYDELALRCALQAPPDAILAARCASWSPRASATRRRSERSSCRGRWWERSRRPLRASSARCGRTAVRRR